MVVSKSSLVGIFTRFDCQKQMFNVYSKASCRLESSSRNWFVSCSFNNKRSFWCYYPGRPRLVIFALIWAYHLSLSSASFLFHPIRAKTFFIDSSYNLFGWPFFLYCFLHRPLVPGLQVLGNWCLDGQHDNVIVNGYVLTYLEFWQHHPPFLREHHLKPHRAVLPLS